MNEIQRMDMLDRAEKDFTCFVYEVFSQSLDIMKNKEWTGGEHPGNVARWMQGNNQTLRVSAKDHFKSMSFYAHIMWKLLKLFFLDQGREIQYFSYKEMMASYHTAKIKIAIKCNPFFQDVIDLKPTAEGILSYRWPGSDKKLTVAPRGLLEFKRGIHSQDVYVDDPFQDPASKLQPTTIKKINNVMMTQIIDMFQNELHVAGTAQTRSDFFFDKNFTKRFKVLVMPAIINEKEKIVLWEEWADFKELDAKRTERTPRIFNQEYQCSPVHAEEAYLREEQVYKCVNELLKNYRSDEWVGIIEQRRKEIEEKKKKGEEVSQETLEYEVVGGFDIGKKTHPSHLVFFEKRPVKGKMKRVQIHSKWMEGWDYVDQLEYLDRTIKAFRADYVYYDNTRGEFESFEEKGELPAEMEPVNFTVKSKNSMAAEMDKAIVDDTIEFLNDQRQINQMLVVNNDLKAPESPEGHGDSFWSNALSFRDVVGDVDINIL